MSSPEDASSTPAEALAAPATPRVWPVFVACAGVFVGIFVANLLLFLGFVLATSRGRPPGAAELERRVDDFATSPAILLASAAVSAVAFGAASLVGGSVAREGVAARLRLHRGGCTAGGVALMLVGLLAAGEALDSTAALFGWSGKGTLGIMARAMSQASGLTLALAVLIVGFMAAPAEELFFHGFMQTRLRDRFGPWPAIGMTAAAFGAVHLDPLHTPLAVAIGLFLGWTTELTDSIRPAMIVHAVNNVVWVLLVAFLPLSWPRAVHLWLAAAASAAAALAIWLLRGAHAARPAVE